MTQHSFITSKHFRTALAFVTKEVKAELEVAVEKLLTNPCLGKPCRHSATERRMNLSTHTLLYSFDEQKKEITLLDVYETNVFFKDIFGT